jgi:hypothetical protein
MKTHLKSVSLSVLLGFFAFIFTPLTFAEPADVTGDIQLSLESDGILVSWTDALASGETSIDHYRVYVDTHAVGDLEEYSEVLDTKDSTSSYTLTVFNGVSLIDTTSYYFSVTAVDSIGAESVNYSEEASIVFLKEGSSISEEEGLDEEGSLDATEIPVLAEATIEEEAAPVGESEDTAEASPINTIAENELVDTSDVSSQPDESLHESASEEDTKAPEDITKLRAAYDLNDLEKDYTVKLAWNASVNSDNDLDYYNYEKKNGGGSYSTAIQMEKDKTSYQTVLPGGERYTFKISSVDNNGNESAGAITSIILPETGPGLLLGLTGLLSLGATRAMRRKSK